jgi:translation initiation factor IF-3
MRFLTQGNKVKVVVKFKGRELAHPEKGNELLDRFSNSCGELCVIEKAPLLDGRNMIMILAPKKNNNAAGSTVKAEAKAEEKPAAEKSQT